MARRGLALLFVLSAFFAVLLGGSKKAKADQPGAHTVPVAVLAFDSDDSEEQADALTGALRSRVRQAPGWSLIETSQSLGMLTAALKCPARPPADCQQRIAEQIKAERYIWGFVAKGPLNGQVTAEVHLYQRGKTDTTFKESYADNLKDGNDDTLRKIAGRIVERLGGTAVGTIVVKAGDQTGEVIIDGEKRVALKDGTARIELAAGGHSVELAASSGTSTKRNVLVSAGRETVVELASPTAALSATPEKPFPTRKVVGGVVAGVGVVLGAVAVWQLTEFLDAKDRGDNLPQSARQLPPNTPPGTECRDFPTGYGQQCKDIDSDMKRSSALAVGAGALGGIAIITGAYLFFTANDSQEKSTAKNEPPKPRARVVPTGGQNGGGLYVVGSF